jgi:hypothetical protein
VRDTDFDGAADVVEGDQAAGVGFLDAFRTGDMLKPCQLDRLADGECVNDGPGIGGQHPDAGFDQFH